jgi:hypothetical protein
MPQQNPSHDHHHHHHHLPPLNHTGTAPQSQQPHRTTGCAPHIAMQQQQQQQQQLPASYLSLLVNNTEQAACLPGPSRGALADVTNTTASRCVLACRSNKRSRQPKGVATHTHTLQPPQTGGQAASDTRPAAPAPAGTQEAQGGQGNQRQPQAAAQSAEEAAPASTASSTAS